MPEQSENPEILESRVKKLFSLFEIKGQFSISGVSKRDFEFLSRSEVLEAVEKLPPHARTFSDTEIGCVFNSLTLSKYIFQKKAYGFDVFELFEKGITHYLADEEFTFLFLRGTHNLINDTYYSIAIWNKSKEFTALREFYCSDEKMIRWSGYDLLVRESFKIESMKHGLSYESIGSHGIWVHEDYRRRRIGTLLENLTGFYGALYLGAKSQMIGEPENWDFLVTIYGDYGPTLERNLSVAFPQVMIRSKT